MMYNWSLLALFNNILFVFRFTSHDKPLRSNKPHKQQIVVSLEACMLHLVARVSSASAVGLSAEQGLSGQEAAECLNQVPRSCALTEQRRSQQQNGRESGIWVRWHRDRHPAPCCI